MMTVPFFNNNNNNDISIVQIIGFENKGKAGFEKPQHDKSCSENNEIY